MTLVTGIIISFILSVLCMIALPFSCTPEQVEMLKSDSYEDFESSCTLGQKMFVEVGSLAFILGTLLSIIKLVLLAFGV